MTTYTNLGITEIVTGEAAGTWGTITNANFELFDTAICGLGDIIAPVAGSSGSPNLLSITDAAVSNGRSRVLKFTSASDLGATVFYQITPSDFRGYYFVQNNLLGSRALTIFQGTYDVGRALTIPANQDLVIMCDGAGVTSYVTAVLYDMSFNSLNVAGAPTSGTSVMNQTAVAAAITTAGSSGITFVSGDQILFRGAAFPSGWVIATGPTTNSTLRIVGGLASAPSSGGSVAFTTVFNGTVITGSTTLTSAQSGVGAHTHPYTYYYLVGTTPPPSNVGPTGTGNFLQTLVNSNTGTAGAANASSGHTHSLSSNAVLYYDMQVIQKT